MSATRYLDLFLIALVLLAAVRDLIERRISNRLVLTGLLAALLLRLAADTPLGALLDGLAGAGVGLLLFLPLYLVRGMAAGDVKLMAMVGAFTGPGLAFDIALATCCIGGVMALAVVLVRGRLRETLDNMRILLRPWLMRMIGVPLAPEPLSVKSVGGLPYGVAIALGTMLMLWIRHG